jgi:hypothetical protein
MCTLIYPTYLKPMMQNILPLSASWTGIFRTHWRPWAEPYPRVFFENHWWAFALLVPVSPFPLLSLKPLRFTFINIRVNILKTYIYIHKYVYNVNTCIHTCLYINTFVTARKYILTSRPGESFNWERAFAPTPSIGSLLGGCITS